MVSRIWLAGVAVVVGGSFGIAQTPAANTISAESSETLRVAPDVARIQFAVVGKDGIAETAADENEKLAKDLLAAITKLKLNGVKVTSQTRKISKVENADNNVAVAPGGGNVPALKVDYRAVRTVTVTVKDADAEQLQTTVAKIQKEAAKIGVSGDSSASVYNGFGNERQNVVRVTYGLQTGWDDKSKDVLISLGASFGRRSGVRRKVNFGDLLGGTQLFFAEACAGYGRRRLPGFAPDRSFARPGARCSVCRQSFYR